MENPIKLSVTIATKNEEKNIENCLRSVQKLADEIIIVDDVSTDSTVEIASRYTRNIIVNDSGGNFHKNKNLAIERASGEWILTLDADEIIPEELAEEIKAAIKNPMIDGYYLNRKNYFMGKWIKGCGWYPDYILRLFRKKTGARWPLEIHDTPKLPPHMKTSFLKNPFLHLSYTSYEQYIQKFNLYTSRIAEEYYQKSISTKNPLIIFYNLLVKPSYYFCKKYICQGGFRDGAEGFFISLSSSFVLIVSYLKLMAQDKKHKEL